MKSLLPIPLASATLLACSPSQPASVSPAPVRTAEAAAAPNPSAVSAPPVPSSPASPDLSKLSVALPERPACVLSGSEPRELAMSLFLSPDGEEVATLGGAEAMSTYFVVGSSAAVVQAEMPGMTLRAYFRSDDVEVHAAKPVLFSGIFVPRASAALQVREAAADHLRVSHDVPMFVEMADGTRSAEADVPCSSLSLDQEAFEPVAGLPDALDQGLLRGPIVSFAASPKGEPVAHLPVRENDHIRVTVIERKPPHLRIVMPSDDDVTIAWIHGRQFRIEQGGEPPTFTPSGPSGDPPRPPRRIFVCPHSVPIQVAQQGQDSKTLAVLHPGSVLAVLADDGPRLEVGLPAGRLSPWRHVRFVVMKEDLEGCREQSP